MRVLVSVLGTGNLYVLFDLLYCAIPLYPYTRLEHLSKNAPPTLLIYFAGRHMLGMLARDLAWINVQIACA